MNFLRKIINRIDQKKSYWSLALKTVVLKFVSRSDKERWEQNGALQDQWQDRTKILAQNIRGGSKVFEFGAGKMFLKNFLPANCTYTPSDLIGRTEEMLIIDLNGQLIDIPDTDYIVFSGVLEYVTDIDKVLKFYSKFTNNILMSYAVLDAFPVIIRRRKEGWISDKSHKEILQLAETINFKISVLGNWKNQRLYHFKRSNT